MKTIYLNKLPLRGIFILELIIGALVLSYFIYLFNNEIYPGIWSFAGPMFGLALFIAGLTGSKIKEINVNVSDKIVEIHKESLFSSRTKKIDLLRLRAELKSGNNKKRSLTTKLRLVILDADKEIEEIKSNFLSMNNNKIEKLYADIKAISKITHVTFK